MIELVKKRRSGWAVLAAGALVASVLAAGAVPAGAVTDRPDHATPLLACVGDAVVDQLFADVSAGHVFRDAINCIAYYEITQGTDDGSTFSPNQDVTRAQMALFIARAAAAAGVDLADASEAGFSDIDTTWQEARDAINRLANNRMIPSGGAFRPADAITRAEMATFLIGLLVEAVPYVTKDSSGAILLGEPGTGSRPDDRFPDAGGAEITAIYELGVTKGASAADVQDDTEPPLDLNYEPAGTVNRGQMAAFITRALAHTSVRPSGVSGQFDGADVIVSVRNARYQPVSRAAVDVFWTPTDQVGRALSTDGTCRLREVTPADRSTFRCEIDNTDPTTGPDGDARVAVTGLRRVPAGGATVWAWTGQPSEVLASGTDLYRFDVAEGADVGLATSALVSSTFNANRVRFGGTVVFTVQLQDSVGDVAAGVNGIDPAQWDLLVDVPGQPLDVDLLDSGLNGRTSFSISLDDPTPGFDGNDVAVTYSLAPGVNAPIRANTVDARGQGAATDTLIFSEEASSIAVNSATVTIDTPRYVHLLGTFAENAVTVTVLDQYGDPVPGVRVSLTSNLPDASLGDGRPSTVDNRGSRRFSYSYGGEAETETLTVSHGVDSLSPSGVTETVYWAVDAQSDDGDQTRPVLTGDVSRRHIVVLDEDNSDVPRPALLEYDDNDRFNLRGEPTSLAAFETELAIVLRQDSPGVSLSWSNYKAGSTARVTDYRRRLNALALGGPADTTGRTPPGPPAEDGAATDRAHVNPAGRYGLEGACGCVRSPVAVVSPAGDGVVAAQPATVPGAGGYGFEGACGCVRSPVAVVSPAGDGVVAAQPATVPGAGGYGFEGACGCVRQPVGVGPPAADGAVAADRARVEVAGGYGFEGA